jgi:hypothetical protein
LNSLQQTVTKDYIVRGTAVAMETTNKQRTLNAYVSDSLQYPRWIIKREVDFTNCPAHGRYDASLPECRNCKFDPRCRWLNQHRTPSTGNAPNSYDKNLLVTPSDCNICGNQISSGCRSMVGHQLPKLRMRVRFPSPAPLFEVRRAYPFCRS